MVSTYLWLFGFKTKMKVSLLFEKGDHPELDTSELLEEKDIEIYQFLFSAFQWVITMGRFDVQTNVMTSSFFCEVSLQGHLNHVKHIYEYISKICNVTIRVRTEESAYSGLPDIEFDWEYYLYGDVKENLPYDTPIPLGTFVLLSHYVDANLFHDILIGCSVTDILHLLNKTHIDWYSKK